MFLLVADQFLLAGAMRRKEKLKELGLSQKQRDEIEGDLSEFNHFREQIERGEGVARCHWSADVTRMVARKTEVFNRSSAWMALRYTS